MASDEPPPANCAVRLRKRRQKSESENRRKEVQEVQEENIKELTVSGHKALQEGRSHDAVTYFSKAVEAAGQVRAHGSSGSYPGCEGAANFPS